MKRIMLVAMAVCLSVTAWAQDWTKMMSRVEHGTIHSEALGCDRNYTIFLPAGYDLDKDRSYPILYLLHGMSDTDRNWYDRGHVKDVMDQLVADGEVEPMIIVTPDAGGAPVEEKQNGYFDMEGWPYEKFFFEEFMPYIESNYRVRAERGQRGVAGLSMGGGGSTSYAERHADKFCACYAMSALMHLPEANAEQLAAGNKFALLTDAVHRLSCVDYVTSADEERVKTLRTVAWYVDCGDDDFLLDCNLDFIKALRAARIPYSLRVRDGGHTWEYWHSALYNALPFFSRTFLANDRRAE